MNIKSANLLYFIPELVASLTILLLSTTAFADNKDWSGPYVGVNVGGKVADANWHTSSVASGSVEVFATSPDASSSQNFNSASARIGGFAGYNWQISKFVIGADLNFAWANNQSSASGIPGCTIACITVPPIYPGPDNQSSSVQTRWDGSIAPRFGFLLTDDTLIYGIGGLAFQDVKTSATCQLSTPDPLCANRPGNPFSTRSNSAVKVGYTVGGGIEEKFGNWMLRAEYRYSQFENLNTTSTFSEGSVISYSVPVNTHIAFMGIAYKF